MNIVQADSRTQRQLCGMLYAAALLDPLDSQVLILSYEGRSPRWIARCLPIERTDVLRRLQKIRAVVAEHMPHSHLERELIAVVKESMRTEKINGKTRRLGLRCICGRKLGDIVSRHCVQCGLLNPRFDPLAYFQCVGFTLEKVRAECCEKRQHVISDHPAKEPYCADCGTRF